MGKVRLLLIVMILATIPACGDDVEPGEQIRDCFRNCYTLESPGEVLSVIESAYNNRRIDWYSGVLDQNFTFFPSPGDVNNGLPESWGRAEEIAIHTKMFDKNNGSLPVQAIFMDIRTEDGVTWVESDSPLNPAEKWYTATLYYDYRFDISPNTYIPLPGAKASFTIRDAGPFGNYQHHWQLVEMHDLADASLISTTSAATEPSTLGAVKALFRK